ncbi:Cytochrome P [Parasponia andersonii]|uniref:Cytochrome P n=1 Tax=Parasponia andersonii TaxID=3476 RepID=A0A2P5E2I5_PARAD|nr:Cytochrome P [Parasponia andersonii]
MLKELHLLSTVTRNHRTNCTFCPFCSMFFKTRDQVESEKLKKGIPLGVLLKAHHDGQIDQRITVDNLVDECKTFYFDGRENTNSFLPWTVYVLEVHRDWQDKARKEVLDLFGKQNPDPDGITKLKTVLILIYLLILFSIFHDSNVDELIINESLRLYPQQMLCQEQS